MLHFLDYDPDDIDVRVSELLTATSDGGDPLVHPKVGEALQVLRRHLNMDVAFVSQFTGGRRTFRVVDSEPTNTLVVAGQSDPVEQSWCNHVVEGRLPQFIRDAAALAAQAPATSVEIGTHLSTPIVMEDGSVYGTLCCFSHTVQPQVRDLDLRRLQIAAKVLAEDLLKSGIGGELQLAPMDAQKATAGGFQGSLGEARKTK